MNANVNLLSTLGKKPSSLKLAEREWRQVRHQPMEDALALKRATVAVRLERRRFKAALTESELCDRAKHHKSPLPPDHLICNDVITTDRTQWKEAILQHYNERYGSIFDRIELDDVLTFARQDVVRAQDSGWSPPRLEMGDLVSVRARVARDKAAGGDHLVYEMFLLLPWMIWAQMMIIFQNMVDTHMWGMPESWLILLRIFRK